MNTRRRVVAVGIVVAGLIACVALYFYQKPSEKVISQQAEFNVMAVDIFNEFDKNEAVANKKYLNKVVSVAGKIADITAVDSLGINIILRADNPLFGVSCQVPSGSPDSKLKVGDQVKITGLCTGKLMDVVLVKCRVENKSEKVKELNHI
jgi:hypothetical protein